jgi:hypothetical protein
MMERGGKEGRKEGGRGYLAGDITISYISAACLSPPLISLAAASLCNAGRPLS